VSIVPLLLEGEDLPSEVQDLPSEALHNGAGRQLGGGGRLQRFLHAPIEALHLTS
jgi:hypothetical protein